MPKTNRECYCCSKKYFYCPSCPSDMKKESFYNMFCCERCSKIFKTLTDETFDHITISQCKEKLIEFGVKSDEIFKDNIKKHIEKVMAYEDVNTDVDIINATQSTKMKKMDSVAKEDGAKKNTNKKMKYVSKSNRNKNSEVDLNSK